MVSCALWEFEEALGWVILNNALAPIMHYSESPTLMPLQILNNAQLNILYCPNMHGVLAFSGSVLTFRYDDLAFSNTNT